MKFFILACFSLTLYSQENILEKIKKSKPYTSISTNNYQYSQAVFEIVYIDYLQVKRPKPDPVKWAIIEEDKFETIQNRQKINFSSFESNGVIYLQSEFVSSNTGYYENRNIFVIPLDDFIYYLATLRPAININHHGEPAVVDEVTEWRNLATLYYLISSMELFSLSNTTFDNASFDRKVVLENEEFTKRIIEQSPMIFANHGNLVLPED